MKWMRKKKVQINEQASVLKTSTTRNSDLESIIRTNINFIKI